MYPPIASREEPDHIASFIMPESSLYSAFQLSKVLPDSDHQIS